MAIEILVTRQGQRLVPHDDLSAQEIEGLKTSGPFMVKVHKPRSLPHNRMYWSCIREICHSGGFDDGEEALHNLNKIEGGCVKYVALANIVYRVPDSTAFAAMNQAEFNTYFRKVVDFWERTGLIEWLPSDLLEKIREAA